jgi:methionine-rich copper-binding protein CopC
VYPSPTRPTQIDSRDALVSKENARRLSISLLALRPGRYSVKFCVMSVDGHFVESSLTFTVKGPR